MLTAQHFSKYVTRPPTELAEAPLWAGTPLLGTDGVVYMEIVSEMQRKHRFKTKTH